MFELFDDVVTTEELADMLKIGYNQIYKLLENQEIKGYKEGKNWRISKQAVISYVLKKSNL